MSLLLRGCTRLGPDNRSQRPPASYKTYIYRSISSRNRQRSRSPTRQETRLAPKTEFAGADALVEQVVTLHEAQTTVEAGSTGLRTWTARCAARAACHRLC